MRDDLVETFQIIDRISNYGSHFFNISPQIGNLLLRQISKTKSTNQMGLFTNRVIDFWKELSNQIKNCKRVKNFQIKLDGFRNNNKKKNLRGYF